MILYMQIYTQNDQMKIQQAMAKVTNYLLFYNVK